MVKFISATHTIRPQKSRRVHRMAWMSLPLWLAGSGIGLLLVSFSFPKTDPTEFIHVIRAAPPLAISSTITTSVKLPSTSYCTPPLCLDWTSAESDGAGIAWGDYDGDGDLDLAVGTRLFRNDNGTLTANAIWSSMDGGSNTVAWGDYDGDGDLDLAGANSGPNHLYRNDNGILTPNTVWTSSEADITLSVAWGDYDGDGDLDLAAGNFGQPSRLYRNDNGSLTTSAIWYSLDGTSARSVAWGDMDGDGDLDLAVGNHEQPNHIYRNDSGILTSNAVWSSSEYARTYSVAWGDVDNDGDLDLAVGNDQQPNRIYRNDAGLLTPSATWSSTENVRTTSVAWSDYDGDGDLDLVAGIECFTGSDPNCRSLHLYRNDAGSLTSSAIWSSTENDLALSVSWGDVDGDGDLDLAVGNNAQPARLYRNTNGMLAPNAVWLSTDAYNNSIVAWGDVDNDGDLDLAVGDSGGDKPDRLYRNDNGTLTTSAVWSTAETDYTYSLAWGDVDGDNDLDLVAGNRCYIGSNPTCRSIALYRNDDGLLTSNAVYSPTATDQTFSVAWGDVDNDGDLDLAVGNKGQPNRLYRNNNGALSVSPVWSSTENDDTNVVAWGDVDGDGDLDLAVGNVSYQGLRLYRNDNGMLTASVVWTSHEGDLTMSIAWGDVDGDGDLDLMAGNWGQPNRLYRNDDGLLTSSSTWSSTESDKTNSVAWGDYDGDGDLDLAVANYGGSNRLYRNDDGVLTSSAIWSLNEINNSWSVAWGDYDSDGDLDLAVGTQYQNIRLYRNTQDGRPFPNSIPTVNLIGPNPLLNANFVYTDPGLRVSTIPISYGLSDPEGDKVSYIRAFYSLNGGGQWYPAVAVSGTPTTNLDLGPHMYQWDVLNSGFLGQSDNVVFRIEAYPSLTSGPNITPLFQHPYASATTFPFRVRGTQVRVLSDTVTTILPISNAIVYRLPVTQTLGALPFADGAGLAFRTDSQGFLQGRGSLQNGDRLMALWPITATDTYTLYYTGAAPTVNGLDMFTVITPGVQTLTVSSANPLLVYNLDVSLEWDARNDETYLSQLQFDLERASQILFDVTNGQAVLGQVRVYQAKEHWDDAHIVVYAHNALRPFAAQGGIVTTTTVEITGTRTFTYTPGQVAMGATWNRYGNPGSNLGEDWPRALAHELGHYLFFLEDNYLGLDSSDHLMFLTSCTGSFMTDAYRNDYSEFLLTDDWLPRCADTLANRHTGRADWATVTKFYPDLNAITNTGPSALPLAITQVQFVQPSTATTTLPDARFYLKGENGETVETARDARAFLYRPNQLVELGQPLIDQIIARGARPGDQVCVYDPTNHRTGCKSLSVGDNQELTLHPTVGWPPDVRVNVLTTQTVSVNVSQVPSNATGLAAQLFTPNGVVIQTLTLSGSNYVTTFTLSSPFTEGYLRLWVTNDTDLTKRRETVVDISMGGNIPVQNPNKRGYRPNKRGYRAPVWSVDGQALIYGEGLTFAPDEFYVLQQATALPGVPSWLTVVGHGYWLSRSVGAPTLEGATLVMSYAQENVPAGAENFLNVYSWDGTTWTALTTTVSADDNSAFAALPGPGLYVLMATIEVQLYGPGWDSFSYPVFISQTVVTALQSISGTYSMVYWNDGSDSIDPWKLYAIDVPAYVNDLYDLRFGEAYWISMTQSAILYLNGSPPISSTIELETTQPNQVFNLQSPPATYYGVVWEGAGFVPAPGMIITAWVDGINCGQGVTREVGDQIVYSINVSADGPGTTGCGEVGQSVTFTVGGQLMFNTLGWNNNRPVRLDLSTMASLYLPMVRR